MYSMATAGSTNVMSLLFVASQTCETSVVCGYSRPAALTVSAADPGVLRFDGAQNCRAEKLAGSGLR
jgi:hypothetical protein